MDLIPITKPNSFAISGMSYPSLTRLPCLTFYEGRLTVGLSSMIPTSVSVRNAAARSAAITRVKITLSKLAAAELPPSVDIWPSLGHSMFCPSISQPRRVKPSERNRETGRGPGLSRSLID